MIASDRARFGQPEIKLGVFPPIAAILLPRIIDEKRARELILTGELIDAREALRIGLVNYVVEPAELERTTHKLLARLQEFSAAALEMAKRAIRLGRQSEFASTLAEIEHLYRNFV